MVGLFTCLMSSDLIDSVELERTVANLNKDLVASREAEEALKDQLAGLQLFSDQVQNLMKQVGLRTSLDPL